MVHCLPDVGIWGGGKNLNFFCGEYTVNGLTLASEEVKEDNPDGKKTSEGKIRVGINKNNPEYAMDVNGVIASNGRVGRVGCDNENKELEVRADGEWHPIITKLQGCQAFEIMAGAGRKNSGKYALLHAFALSTFKSKKGNITYHQAHYSSRCEQIVLRWRKGENDKDDEYSLEMRTGCSFEQNANEKIFIRYYITKLWFDPLMDGCAEKSSNPKPGAE